LVVGHALYRFTIYDALVVGTSNRTGLAGMAEPETIRCPHAHHHRAPVPRCPRTVLQGHLQS
jgi:hypothetical protein